MISINNYFLTGPKMTLLAKIIEQMMWIPSKQSNQLDQNNKLFFSGLYQNNFY